MKHFAFAILTTFCFSTFFGQNSTTYLPHSAYYLGEFQSSKTNSTYGLEGFDQTMSDKGTINVSNPATYSQFEKYRTLFDFSLQLNTTTLNSQSGTSRDYNNYFRNFVMGIPIKQGLGMIIGWMPYTLVGYDISDKKTISEDDVTQTYEGKGSINKLMLGFGKQFQFNQMSLSLGFNVSGLFGNVKKTKSSLFTNSGYNNVKNQNKRFYNGALYELGMLYKFNNKNKKTIVFGSSLEFGQNLWFSERNVMYSFTKNGSTGVEKNLDTVSDTYKTQFVNLPIILKFSLQLPLAKNYQLGIGYQQQFKMAYQEQQQGFSDKNKGGFRLSAGILYKNEDIRTDVNKIWLQKMSFSLGGYYQSSGLIVLGESISNYGLKTGISIPSARSFSNVNIGLKVGWMESFQNLKTFYFGVNIGACILPNAFDKWFYKRQYN